MPDLHLLAGHGPVLVILLLDLFERPVQGPRLHAVGEPHVDYVAQVQQEEDRGLVPHDLFVEEHYGHNYKVYRVEAGVASKWVPCELQGLGRHDRAGTDHEKHVEHGRPDDGAGADIGLRHKRADERGEELRSGAARGHEGGAGHVRRDVQDLGDDLQCRHEALVADDRDRGEHVQEAYAVEQDGAVPPLLERELVLGIKEHPRAG
mmetsp:Transcript_38229/g.118891  ORF Transcript_38229/g.118891 Transcript_38229/m.118891 type:complete len:206 (-) Transcript_38229:234-851(-)